MNINQTTIKLFILSLLTTSIVTKAASISPEQVSADITYLASDELQGRGNFSEGIEKAGEYISKRYQEIGLIPLKGEKGFLQEFKTTNFKTSHLKVVLNGVEILPENRAIVSTVESVNWSEPSDVNVHFISSEDNMRARLSSINQNGGNNLVIINPSHGRLFQGYKGFFNRGLNKLGADTEGGTILMVLSDITKIETINAKATTNITKNSLKNVAGIIPGKSKADEVVLFSAHYDHLGINPGADGDKIHNGANDDASGTTAVISLAKYFKELGNNERTLMFVAFAGEEIGGFGSKYFSTKINPDNVTAMINIEMIGKSSKFGSGEIWMTGMERSNLGDLMNESLKNTDLKIHQDPYPSYNLFYRSDNATLARLGVPAHSFSTTELDKDKDYHQASDEVKTLDLKSMHQTIEVIAKGSAGLVMGTATPSRVDVNKVTNAGKIY